MNNNIVIQWLAVLKFFLNYDKENIYFISRAKTYAIAQ